MNDKFMSHVFKKVCSEPRGGTSDELIKMAIAQNADRLRNLVDSKNHAWIPNILSVDVLFFALSQLQDYYSGGAVSGEQWELASYYAYNELEKLEGELLKADC